MAGDIERIKTYIEGLDPCIEGGIPKGSVSLICGTPGSMKSSLAYSILYHNKGMKSVYITLEQDINSLMQQMRKLNMGKRRRNLTIADFDTIERKLKKEVRESKFEYDWIRRVKGYVKGIGEEKGYDLLVIDSLDALYSLVSIQDPRREIYYLFKELRDEGVTSFFISEMSLDKRRFSRFGVEEFLADAIIHLEFQKRGDILTSLERYVGIVKMRSTNHDTQYFPMLYTGDRFTVIPREELVLE
ncbi:MAG: RAD55 family ATPase [Candidatus Hydrothermarchaeales archaeon]